MAYDKVVDSAVLDADLKTVADSIRAKGGTSAQLSFPDGMAAAVAAIQTGGGNAVIQPLAVTANGTYTAPAGVDGYSPVTVNVAGSGGGGGAVAVPAKDVNFRDYDGTVLYAYTAAEAASLTELPPLPERGGLICQGWNWSLSNVKSYAAKYGKCEVGAMYITDDGKTRIYIRLEKDRTSPMLGCCPNGTVTVDWGDGTNPDVLTGTSTSSVKWTPNHAYAQPGDYMITLTVEGAMGFYGSSSSDQASGILRHAAEASTINYCYRNAVKKVEVGNGVTSIRTNAFHTCQCLASITIPDSVTSILTSAFYACDTLTGITIPDSVTSIESYVFNGCQTLTSITIPDSVTSIGTSAFNGCHTLTSITIPDGVISIGSSAFASCYSLTGITIPDSVTRIEGNAFGRCNSLGAAYLNPATPPTLSATTAFSNVPTDCVFYVPAGSLAAYQAATNWSTLTSTYTFVEVAA